MRSRAISLAGLFAGGLLGLVAASQPWWRASGSGASVNFTGTQVTGGLATALAVVVLAGVLLVLAVGAGARRMVGVLLALAGLGMLLSGLRRSRPSAAAVRDRMATVTLADSVALGPTLWPWLYALAGALIAAAAAVLVWRAGRWPTRPARFERASTRAASDMLEDPAQAWRALDAGLDPTVSDSDITAGTDAPNVQAPRPGVTMEGKEEDPATVASDLAAADLPAHQD